MVSCYFGLPGCGKSSTLAKIAYKANKRIKNGTSKYDKVYTNFSVADCYRINFKDLGLYNFENALILLDEVTLFADSREYKSFPYHIKEFFMLHRHYNCDIIYFTQDWKGVDKKIRDVTNDLYYLRSSFQNVNFILFRPLKQFSFATKIFRTLEINQYTNEIVVGYRFPTLFERIFSRTRQLVFRPLYYKYFDSWERPRQLPDYNNILWFSSADFVAE